MHSNNATAAMDTKTLKYVLLFIGFILQLEEQKQGQGQGRRRRSQD